MDISFHLPQYDGPLDLLLALIQKEEVSIYDIPISQITDQFLSYIRQAESIGLSDLSQFYVEAANLIWIKSQMMLPKDVEFDDQFTDPREELVERLLEYSKYRKYSQLLMGNEDYENIKIDRKPSEFMIPFSDEDLLDNATLDILRDTYLKLMSSYEDLEEELPFNIFETVTENEKIALMNELLESSDSIRFSQLYSKGKTDGNLRLHIICAFLAVLEAVKDHLVVIEQDESFGEIIIRKREVSFNPNLADDYDSQYDEIVASSEDD